MMQMKPMKRLQTLPCIIVATSHGGVTVTDPKPSASSASDVEKVSIDKYRNYAGVAGTGTITALGAIGWYIKGTAKKPEVQD